MKAFVLLAILAVAAAAPAHSPAPAPAPAGPPPPPPIIKLLKENGTFSHTWLFLRASGLASMLASRRTAPAVFFAPTNAAWEAALPRLATAMGCDAKCLLSEARSTALNELLKYHFASAKLPKHLPPSHGPVTTLLNLGSDAKLLAVDEAPGGGTALLASGGGGARVLGDGVSVGSTTVFAIDDVLLPAALTLPLRSALSADAAALSKLGAGVTPADGGEVDALQRASAASPSSGAAPPPAPSAEAFRRRTAGGVRGGDDDDAPAPPRRAASGGGSGRSSSSSSTTRRSSSRPTPDPYDYVGDSDDGSSDTSEAATDAAPEAAVDDAAVAAQSASFDGEDSSTDRPW